MGRVFGLHPSTKDYRLGSFRRVPEIDSLRARKEIPIPLKRRFGISRLLVSGTLAFVRSWAMKNAAILLVVLLLSVPVVQAQDISAPAGTRVSQSSESRQVWVNTGTGVYHYPGTRWYGNTKSLEPPQPGRPRSQDLVPLRALPAPV